MQFVWIGLHEIILQVNRLTMEYGNLINQYNHDYNLVLDECKQKEIAENVYAKRKQRISGILNR